MNEEHEPFDLFDEMELEVSFKIKMRAVGDRVVGLKPIDVSKYLTHHAKRGAEDALAELYASKKTLDELGFS